MLRIKHSVRYQTEIVLHVFKWNSASCLLLLSSCYPIRQYLRRWMECLTLKNHLLPCTYCVILSPSLSFISAPTPIHLSFSLFIYLNSLHLFSVMHSPSLHFALCPSLLPKDGLSFCLFIILNPSHTDAHSHLLTLKILLSFWLSSYALLALSSWLFLFILSRNSVNLRFVPFLFYLWLFIDVL